MVDFETNMKKLTINGKTIEIESDTIETMLMELGIPRQIVAVAVNSEIVPRSEHSEQILSDGDCVEIIRPIGGG